MVFFEKRTPWEKEWALLQKKELLYTRKKDRIRQSKINELLANKIPDKLQETLEGAFEKAFRFIFEKGKGIIEKTYGKEEVNQQHEIDQFAMDLKKDRKSLKTFSKRAGMDGTKNILLSGVEGIGLGALGIGIPDIPLFIGMVIKSLNELSLRYGFEYEGEEERFFQLKLIEAALLDGIEYGEADRSVELFILEVKLPVNYDRGKQISATASTFSKELLYMKFLQGIPIVGVAGGIYDAVYLKQILEYAALKYQKRFLLKQKRIMEESRSKN